MSLGTTTYFQDDSIPTGGDYFLKSSTLQCMRTSSLATSPPVSVTACQANPNPFRLIFPLIEKPAQVLPQGSLMIPPNSTSSFTDLVTSRMGRSPYNS